MDRTHVVGVVVTDRFTNAAGVQKILTEHGCNIKTRLGLHDVNEDVCSRRGLLLLELFGAEDECNLLVSKLKDIDGIQVQEMVFTL